MALAVGTSLRISRLTTAARVRMAVLVVVATVLIAACLVPTWRSNTRDALAVVQMMVGGIGAHPRSVSVPHRASRDNPYRELRANGKARVVLDAARRQIGTPYALGAAPRHAWSLRAVGDKPDELGLDCSTLVAYAFVHGAGIWPGGRIAHTDEIWTQGGALPLRNTPAETSKIIRGTGATPPPGGYQSGDLLFRREGAGGWWGHVAIVSEHGYVIEALPPDVHEDTEITTFLDEGDALGWLRVKAL